MKLIKMRIITFVARTSEDFRPTASLYLLPLLKCFWFAVWPLSVYCVYYIRLKLPFCL